MENLLYHYTPFTESHFGSILADGLIKREGETGRYFNRTRKALGYQIPCPAVWFSANTDFEPTAAKICVGPRTGKRVNRPLAEHRAESARIGVDPAGLMSWQEFRYRGPVRYNLTKNKRKYFQEHCTALEVSGRAWGADPADWFCTFDPVGASAWWSIESWTDGAWRPLDIAGDTTGEKLVVCGQPVAA